MNIRFICQVEQSSIHTETVKNSEHTWDTIMFMIPFRIIL